MANILIIEDSPTEAHVFKRLLEKRGYNVEISEDAENGMNRAQTLLPDVILMDVVMPGVNGFQATRELRRQQSTSGIPIIMITTKGQETDRIWGIRQGACDYLVKPVKEAALLKSVYNAVNNRAVV